jgi:gluconate 2-dehydrogenase gamma chain
VTDQSTSDGSTPHMTDEQVAERITDRILSRRGFLRAGAATGIAAASLSLPLAAVHAGAQTPPSHGDHSAVAQAQLAQAQQVARLGGFEYFNTFQAEIVNAAAGRIVPTDDNGPGAVEAGVVYFIDRQLSASYGLVGRRYEQGPFEPGAATQGDQSGLEMSDRYRLGIQGMDDYSREVYQKGFAQLAANEQDRVLADMESGVPKTFDGTSIQAATTELAGGGTEALQRMAPGAPGIGASAFFQLLRSHVLAGFFADPVHGGNRDMVGWKLIGFPGAQMSYSDWITRYGVPFDGPYKSLSEHQAQFAQGA